MKRRGTTLVEVLVASALVATLAGAGAGLLVLASRGLRQGVDAAALAQDLSWIEARLRADLWQLVADPRAPGDPARVEDAGRALAFWVPAAPAEHVPLMAAVPTRTRRWELVDAGPGELRLLRDGRPLGELRIHAGEFQLRAGAGGVPWLVLVLEARGPAGRAEATRCLRIPLQDAAAAQGWSGAYAFVGRWVAPPEEDA